MYAMLYILPLIVILSTALAVPIPHNHIIRFEGLQHGYNNSEVARQELKSNLNRITGRQDIVIDSLDESGAFWYSEDIDKLPGDCPESEIRELFSSIVSQDGSYTRAFKMQMTENFSPPAKVTIEWKGKCENVARKRTVDGSPTATIATGTTTTSATKSGDTNTGIETPTRSQEDVVSATSNAAGPALSNAVMIDSIIETVAPIPGTTTTAPLLPLVSNEAEKATVTTTTQMPSEESFTEIVPATAQALINLPFDTTTTAASTTVAAVQTTTTTGTTSAKASSVLTTSTSPVDNETVAQTTDHSTKTAGPTTTTPTVTSVATETNEALETAEDLDEQSGDFFAIYIATASCIFLILAYIVGNRAYNRRTSYYTHND